MTFDLKIAVRTYFSSIFFQIQFLSENILAFRFIFLSLTLSIHWTKKKRWNTLDNATAFLEIEVTEMFASFLLSKGD